MSEAPSTLVGLHHLAPYPAERVLVVTQDLDREALSTLQSLLPGTTIAALGEAPGADVLVLSRSVPQALVRIAQLGFDAIVAAQPLRKLTLMACAVPGAQGFALKGAYLEPLQRTQVSLNELRVLDNRLSDGALWGAWETVQRGAQRRLRDYHLADRQGVANDYSFIEDRVQALPPGWPRRSATVVLPVYNRRDILEKTLCGLLHQTYPRELFDVVIADDGSHDHPEALVHTFSDGLRLSIVRQADEGFRAAGVRNLGMRAAQGEVIVLLDCDMLPAPTHLEETMKWFHTGEQPVVVIGDRIFINSDDVSAEQVRQDMRCIEALEPIAAPSAVRDPKYPTRDWRHTHYERYRGLKDHTSPYQFAASGNLAFFRRDALAIGGFDESYTKWGGEDVEFGYRLYRRGAYFVPEVKAAAYHQDHPEAAVREQDRLTTRTMTQERIPDRRVNAAGRRYPVPKITVLIHGPDDAESMQRSLQSLGQQSFVDFEVLVVTHDEALPLQEPWARRVPPEQGLQQAKAEFYLALEAGDRLSEDALGLLLQAMEQDPHISMAFGDLQLGAGEVRQGDAEHGPRLVRVRDLFRLRHHEAAGPTLPGSELAALGLVRHIRQPLLVVREDPSHQRALRDSTAPATARGPRLGRALKEGLRGHLRSAVAQLIDDG